MFELYIFFIECFQHDRYVELRLRIFGSFQWLLEICHKKFASLELKLQWKLSLQNRHKSVALQQLNFKKQLTSAQNWNFSENFWLLLFVPCVSRACALTCFSLSSIYADLQYMVKSYIWTAEKILGLNLSGLGLKTTMITSAWCSTPSTTRATNGRILSKTTTNKQTKQKRQSKHDNIVKSG